MKYNIDDIIEKEVKKAEIDCPIFSIYIFKVTVFIWRKFDIYLDFLETNPYALDGTIPIIFLRLGFLEISFYSKKIYKYLYKRKYNERLDI